MIGVHKRNDRWFNASMGINESLMVPTEYETQAICLLSLFENVCDDHCDR